jgi:hypothetical protein
LKVFSILHSWGWSSDSKGCKRNRPKEYIMMRARSASTENDEMWRTEKVILEYQAALLIHPQGKRETFSSKDLLCLNGIKKFGAEIYGYFSGLVLMTCGDKLLSEKMRIGIESPAVCFTPSRTSIPSILEIMIYFAKYIKHPMNDF